MKNVANETVVLSLEMRSRTWNDDEEVKRHVLKDLKREGLVVEWEVKEDCGCGSREKEMSVIAASLEETGELLKNLRNEESKWIDVDDVRRIVSWIEEFEDD